MLSPQLGREDVKKEDRLDMRQSRQCSNYMRRRFSRGMWQDAPEFEAQEQGNSRK